MSLHYDSRSKEQDRDTLDADTHLGTQLPRTHPISKGSHRILKTPERRYVCSDNAITLDADYTLDVRGLYSRRLILGDTNRNAFVAKIAGPIHAPRKHELMFAACHSRPTILNKHQSVTDCKIETACNRSPPEKFACKSVSEGAPTSIMDAISNTESKKAAKVPLPRSEAAIIKLVKATRYSANTSWAQKTNFAEGDPTTSFFMSNEVFNALILGSLQLFWFL